MLGSDAEKGLPKLQQIDAEEASSSVKAKNEAAEHLSKRAPFKRMALALLSRGWKIGRPQLHIGEPCGLSPLHA